MKSSKFKQILQKTTCFVFFIIFYNNVFSQGAWSIRYLPLDSLNNSFIGKEVRLDFKSSFSDTLSLYGNVAYGRIKVNYVRWLLSKKDTVKLIINQKIFPFIEDWLLYPDEVSLEAQKMIYVGKLEEYRDANIKNFIIISISNLDITLDCYLDFENSSKSEKHRIIVDKSIVKGIIIKDY